MKDCVKTGVSSSDPESDEGAGRSRFKCFVLAISISCGSYSVVPTRLGAQQGDAYAEWISYSKRRGCTEYILVSKEGTRLTRLATALGLMERIDQKKDLYTVLYHEIDTMKSEKG